MKESNTMSCLIISIHICSQGILLVSIKMWNPLYIETSVYIVPVPEKTVQPSRLYDVTTNRCHQVLSLNMDVQPKEEKTKTLVCFKPSRQTVFWHTLFDTEMKIGMRPELLGFLLL